MVHRAVRLVQIRIPAGSLETVTTTLDAADVDYVVTEETSSRDFTAVVTFPLPTNAVESVLDELREAGIDKTTYTVVVKAETSFPRSSTSSQTPTTKKRQARPKSPARSSRPTPKAWCRATEPT